MQTGVKVVATALAGAVLVFGAGAQLDPDQVAKEALKTLKEAVEERDPAAMQQAITDFDVVWDQTDKKTQGKIVKAVGKLFESYKSIDAMDPETLTTDEGDVAIVYEMSVGLLFDKPGGDAALAKALKQPHVKKWPEVQTRILDGLGHRKDPETIDTVSEYLEHDNVYVAASAGRALGRLAEAERDARQDAVEALIGAYLEAERKAEKERKKEENGPREEFLLGVEVAYTEALTALTRQRFDTASDWNDWYRKEGRKGDW
jgi:hypothetical protein